MPEKTFAQKFYEFRSFQYKTLEENKLEFRDSQRLITKKNKAIFVYDVANRKIENYREAFFDESLKEYNEFKAKLISLGFDVKEN